MPKHVLHILCVKIILILNMHCPPPPFKIYTHVNPGLWAMKLKLKEWINNMAFVKWWPEIKS